jgi:hypothetical protein
MVVAKDLILGEEYCLLSKGPVEPVVARVISKPHRAMAGITWHIRATAPGGSTARVCAYL